jgi:hypothetical protein
MTSTAVDAVFVLFVFHDGLAQLVTYCTASMVLTMMMMGCYSGVTSAVSFMFMQETVVLCLSQSHCKCTKRLVVVV